MVQQIQLQQIRWGIIGCGDVCEVKSGPAFYKAPGSALLAVMRRDGVKAADFARRHGAERWYTDMNQLIADPEVDAVYIASPPAAHEAAALAAIKAGKPVYLEKPMAHTAASAHRIAEAAGKKRVPLCVAHYRRMQPLFLRVRQLLQQQVLGAVRNVVLQFAAPGSGYNMADERVQWRLNPAISGGGIFHDLAPHQLDLLFYLLGKPLRVNGLAVNVGGRYTPPDSVGATLLFPEGVLAHCSWLFEAADGQHADQIQINGERGWMRFPVFGSPALTFVVDGKHSEELFLPLQHVQQPMIEAVNAYFTGTGPNPCDAAAGLLVMETMEQIVGGKALENR